MDPKQITSLANLLRDSGDKVLNSEFKLTLSGSLLRALNDSFTLITDQTETYIPSQFQVVKLKNSTKSDVFRDLQLIHDFVQKTIILCIKCFHDADDHDHFDGVIDIRKFRCLRTLEIQRINIKQIIGIQPLRGQLKNLICVRSLKSIDDIIIYCGGDNSNGFMWNELESIDFSYNNLMKIDKSLEFVPSLQVLNLSHNQLVNVEAIKWLPNLKIINLSFNRLTFIPHFHMDASRHLQILLLNNNFIEDINDIQRLDALTEFDLSDNCLLDHKYLLPIRTLIALKYLNLSGNPLYYHPNHRQATAYYLHKNTASVKFVLDSSPLTKNEKSLVGNYQNYHHGVLTSRLSRNRSSGQTTPTSYNRNSQTQTPSSSIGSITSFKFNNSETIMNSSAMTTTKTNETMTSSTNEKQKKLRRRTIDLEQTNSSATNNDDNNSRISKKLKNHPIISASTDHLETKKQIEDLRHKFGAGWLHSDNAHMVKSLIGLNDNDNDDEDIKTRKITPKQLIDDLLGRTSSEQQNNSKESINENEDNVKILISSTPKDISKGELLKISSVGAEGEETKVNNTNESFYTNASDDGTVYKSVLEENTSILNEIYSSGETDETEVSEPEDNENNYIVYDTDPNNELLLTVSDTSIKEKDILTTRTKTKWSLKILQSCDRIKANTLRINFDTVKKDKRERVYTVEENLCLELESYLREILSKRLLSEMNQTVYRCINCSCQFSRENTNIKKNLGIFCPECKSAYIVEVHEPSPGVSVSLEYQKELLKDKISSIPVTIAGNTTAATAATSTATTAAIQTEAQPTADVNLHGINDNTSGSGGSLNESSSCSKISHSQSSFDSNQSVAGSSTNERDIDLLNFCNKTNYESDVEILSNPSQSSIEVLDGSGGIGFITAANSNNSSIITTGSNSRKSSEERRILQIPLLETIDDRSLGNDGSGNTVDNGIWNYDLQKLTNFDTIVTDEINSKMKTDSACEVKVVEETLGISGIGSEELKKNNITSDLSGKKSLLSNANLTESSSSGSVTDSICTTYEHNDKGSIPDVATLSIGGGATDTFSNGVPVTTISEKEIKKDESIISSMLGGLFQSTNILMSRSQKSNTNSDLNVNLLSSTTTAATTTTTEKFKFNYENFGDADHRLKLYFYQTKFDDPNEHFKWLVKSKIYNEQNQELYDGIIVMSTTKFYIMKIIGSENDDITKWLRQVLSVRIDRIEMIQLLPWHIGLSFKIRNWGSFLLLLQDILRTDSLLLFLANNPLPSNCTIEYQISEKFQRKLSYFTDSEQLKMFSLLNKCEIFTTINGNNLQCDDNISCSTLRGLLTTDSHLYLTKPDFSWLSNNFDTNIQLSYKQIMCNLIEIDRSLTNPEIFSINFLDETNDKTELWKCEFITRENADSCLNAIGQSWEKLFGLPLVCN